MSLEAVILDVDGTLVDSERDGHRVAFNAAFEELGLPWRWDVEEYGRLLAVTGGQARLHAYLEEQGVPAAERDELVPRLHGRKTEVFLELVSAGEVPARPGVGRFLDEVAAAGLRLAVATTGSRAWVEPLLDRHFGLDRFETVVAGDDVTATKPDPAAYLIALERLGLAPAQAVAIEDSVPGLGAARAAGVPCLVVTNDYTAGGDFTGAALVVDGFDELDVATLRSLPVVRLREATPADLAVVAALIRALAVYEHLEDEVRWTEEELGRSLFGPGAVPRVVLAEVGGGIVAGLAIWFPTYSTFRGRPGIWLEDLFVRPEHRGLGVGRVLLDHLFERAGDGRVEWAVLDWNAPSIAFYESLGARPVAGWTIYRWLRNSQASGGPGPEQ